MMLDPIPPSMRAVVITKPGHAEVREVATPRLATHQVLIQVEGCGVCSSNLPLWEGRPWFEYPTAPGAPGHEGWGLVAAFGSGVRGLGVGERVAFLSDRAFAEYDVAPATSIVRIPRELAEHDLPGEPLGCAMNICRRAQLSEDQTIAVVGIGFLGALVVQIASSLGAKVIAISQRECSLELARKMGACETIVLGDDHDAIVHRVSDLTGARMCERVVEMVGLQGPLDLATKLCAIRGRLVIGGFHQDGPRQVDMFQWNWRGIDVINAHERDPAAYVSGMAVAVDRVVAKRLDPSALYTHRIPMDRATEAFELMRTRPPGYVKALITR
jgi:threonine dehydrogenase-like Zn-dependent dehydrogenase